MIAAVSDERWRDANHAEWEMHWWGLFAHGNDSAFAETKNLWGRYIPVMKLWPQAGLSVVDIGGGPFSMLYGYPERGRCAVVDPLPIPQDCVDRYRQGGIEFLQLPAEVYMREYSGPKFDEAWIYNCLQHVQDPIAILSAVPKCAKVLRICEPMETIVEMYHPHSFGVDEFIGLIRKHVCQDADVTVVRTCDYAYCGGVFEVTAGSRCE